MVKLRMVQMFNIIAVIKVFGLLLSLYVEQNKQRAKEKAELAQEAVDAFKFCSTLEGIIPALESSHAIAYARKIAHLYDKDDIIVINLSGSGSKDLGIIESYL